LLDPELVLSAEVETLLFAAARRAMLDLLVEPALASGRDVVCERFHPSTFAYQAVAGGVAETELLSLLEGWAGRPRPDLVILLDLPVEESLRRRKAGSDRFEGRGQSFQIRVAEGYRRYARLAGGVCIVDARGSIEEVAARVLAEVRRGPA
jgi:dTMP kinase